ncbi:transposase [Embleya sp. NPDC005575]|uniref:transposase n=1 Tax=Embleya sp. NPDC005575 TaxID=3156892 RepID=UPI0033BAA97A
MTNSQWTMVEPLLPDRAPQRGGRWIDHRAMIDAVAWKHEYSCSWRELPEWFGPWQTVYHRYTVWGKDGTWRRILTRLQVCPDPDGDLDWLIEVDGALSRASRAEGGKVDR